MTEKTQRHWIAINGSSCAIGSMPMRNPVVVPTPEQMFGFPTREEAQKAQQICLTAPMPEVVTFFESLRPDVDSGRVVYRRPDNPDRQTREQTMWMDGPDDGVVEDIARVARHHMGAEILPGLPGNPLKH